MTRPPGYFDALRRFDDEYIHFPPFVEAARLIEEILTLFRETGIAQNLLILGKSGTGKSSLCNLMGQKYKRFSLPDRDVVSVLVVSVPPAATIVSMVDQMLTQLGDPSPTSGTASTKTARLIRLCKACKVELILLDEAQHIHDRGQASTHYKVGDWLKVFIDEVAVPTVFLGLPRLENLLQVNEQLRRRFSRRVHLALGQSDSENLHDECLQLFISLANSLPVSISEKPYDLEEFGMRLYYASDGRVAHIKKLLACALRWCLERDVKVIDPAILETAFTEELWWEGIGKLNPFNDAFEFRPLDRGGEPFETIVAEGRKPGRKKKC